MRSELEKWHKLKNNYLKQVEQALASIDHPKSRDVLRDVDEHLERKHAELGADKQNWEGYQTILIEMGPPEEYAELLAEEKTPTTATTSGFNGFLAVVFIIVLMIVGGYLIYNAKKTPTVDVADEYPIVFCENMPVDGITMGQSYCTADFVQSLLGAPNRIDSNGRMLRYTDDGIDFWFSGNGPLSEIHLNQGFQGKLDTGISLSSSQEDVFKTYGSPVKKINASDLHRKNDERVLYKKADASRIYYGSRGLIFWFKNDAIMQIVVFKGKLFQQATLTQSYDFESDERVLGKWVTIDFVKIIDEFDPARKNWAGRLYLQSLEFQDNGTLQWKAENKVPFILNWTKGKVRPLDKRPSFYYLRNIDGRTYLFYEWVSGDVTERGREPAYYVLKQVQEGETVLPVWFEEDPQVIGFWVSVDFVKNINDFQPGVQHTTDLFLKTLQFENNGKLWWTIGESKPIALDWTKGKIRPFGIWPAAYSIKRLNQTDYLFYEYRTSNNNPAGYYVFKRATRPESVKETKTQTRAFQNDPQVLGRWTTVDFVRTPDTFRPNRQSWRGDLFVKSLDFQQAGIVEWCLGEDQMKIKHHWTKGLLNPDDELGSRYFIERYDDSDYLFMEWNSGDVTIRGQKPAYYVLKKAE